MTRWTADEKAAIGSLRKIWDRVENGLKDNTWLSQYDKSEIREALKTCRYHVNSGNTNPRPLELYHNMRKMSGNENWNIETLIQEAGVACQVGRWEQRVLVVGGRVGRPEPSGRAVAEDEVIAVLRQPNEARLPSGLLVEGP